MVSIEDLRFFRPGIEEVTKMVARYFKVDSADIKENQQGKSVENIPRWVVMYLAQENCGLKLREIADFLELKRTGSISTTISKLKLRMEADVKLAKRGAKIKGQYNI